MKKERLLRRVMIEDEDVYNKIYDIKHILNDINASLDSNEQKEHKGVIGRYTRMASLLSGTFFSGAGYLVAGTGTLLLDLANYLAHEIPNIPYYINQGIGPNTLSDAYIALQGAFIDAQYKGSIGAAVGLLGGSMAMVRMRSGISDMIESFFSRKSSK